MLFILIFFIMISTNAFAEPLDHVVAVVNDDVITATELQTQINELRQQLIAKKMPIPSENTLREQVLQHLIDITLQLQLAKQNNIVIDGTELDAALHKIAETNHLNLSELRTAVEQQGFHWKNYREKIKKEIILSHLQQKAINKNIVISAKDIENYLASREHQNLSTLVYHLQNIVIPLPEKPNPDQLYKAKQEAKALLEKAKKEEDFIQLALTESNNEFSLNASDLGERHLTELPEIFAQKVTKMKIGEMMGPIRTGNGFQLIRLVNVRSDELKHQVTKTHVRHILLKQDASLTPEEFKKQALNIYYQLQAGKKFEELAKKYSLDIVSAEKGGDLGWVTAGELVPEFEKAMDALPLHQVSKPVKTIFGLHLIEVLERKSIVDTKSYERQKVREFLQGQKFSEAVQNWLQHIRAGAYIKLVDKGLA